jgi:hypothetical protein
MDDKDVPAWGSRRRAELARDIPPKSHESEGQFLAVRHTGLRSI